MALSKKSSLMLDTNIFNAVLDQKINIDDWKRRGCTLYATKIQYEELLRTSCCKRRKKLLETYILVDAREESSSFAWDVPGAGWGDAEWGDEQECSLYKEIFDALEKKKKKKNNKEDALIAVACKKHNMVLVTVDKNLRTVAESKGITVAEICDINKSPDSDG